MIQLHWDIQPKEIHLEKENWGHDTILMKYDTNVNQVTEAAHA